MLLKIFVLFFMIFTSSISLAQLAIPELDYLKNTKLYKQAEKGDRSAMYNLCVIYFYGDGKSYRYSKEDGRDVPIFDLRSAFNWCKKAGDAGEEDAKYHFGMLNLLNPDGDFKLGQLGANKQTGLNIIRSLAQGGHTLAQVEMAKQSQGESDILYWERQAAKGGHIPSKYNVAMSDFFSDNSAKQKTAVQWFLNFVYENIGKFGIYSIGHIAEAYQKGKGGLEQDYIKAYAWQSLYVEYYPSCQDTESFRASLLKDFKDEGQLSEQEIQRALDLAQKIKKDIESKAEAQLKRPYSTC